MIVSVIFGTYNRFESLKRCIEGIRLDLGHSYEIIVADGGSVDGSREWLVAQDDVVMVGLRHLGGAVEAFNLAYRASRGSFIVTLNDDVVPRGGALRNGLALLHSRPNLGQVALLWERKRGVTPITEQLSGLPYANYGVVRREAAEAAAHVQGGFWNPCYRTYGADCELSAWLHHLGWDVAAITDASAGYIEDHEIQDKLRAENHHHGRAQADGKLFWKRWGPETVEMLAGKALPHVTLAEFVRLSEVRRREKPPVSVLEPALELNPGTPAEPVSQHSTVE